MKSMNPRQNILSRFETQGLTSPIFMPDLTLWYNWHKNHDTLPQQFKDATMAHIAAELGCPAWIPVRPWRMEGVNVTEEKSPTERVLRYKTPARELTERWTLGPDGDWWQVEYPVKGMDDLDALEAILESRSHTLPNDIQVTLSRETHENHMTVLEMPMQPYSDMLHNFLGWSDGLMLLMGKGKARLTEMMGLMEAKLEAMAQAVKSLPVDLILSPDNLDGQYISPMAFKNHFSQSYGRTAKILHSYGKKLIVHMGGPGKHLLPLMAEAGVDAVQGISGPPQSNADLAEARTVAGPNLTLWGGIPQDLLMATHEETELINCVEEAISHAKQDGRVIIGVADRVPVGCEFSRLKTVADMIATAQ